MNSDPFKAYCIARYCHAISAIPDVVRYLCREVSTPQKWCDAPPSNLVSQARICAIPHFATYRATIVQYRVLGGAGEGVCGWKSGHNCSDLEIARFDRKAKNRLNRC